jgi:hypothetical protein
MWRIGGVLIGFILIAGFVTAGGCDREDTRSPSEAPAAPAPPPPAPQTPPKAFHAAVGLERL